MKGNVIVSLEASGRSRRHDLRTLIVALTLATLGIYIALSAGTALAAKQAVDYFGTESGAGTLGGQFDHPKGIAVNSNGAGPANRGDVYVVDSRNNRIERFSRNDNGTPADADDDTYDFVSAWGAGVDAALGGSSYQICTVASECQAGVSTDGNGALGFSFLTDLGPTGASGLAIDEDTGEVYVTDADNHRVNVYAGDGAFLRSFGYECGGFWPRSGFRAQ